jgi:hypothetical protein
MLDISRSAILKNRVMERVGALLIASSSLAKLNIFPDL